LDDQVANTNHINKKEIETRALEAARRVNALIPAGEIQPREKPDFTIESATELVGIEVTELLPAAASDSFSSSLAERSFHQKVIELAETEYNRTPGAIPVGVGAFFWKIDSGKYDKNVMACALAEFVRSNREKATPVANFSWRADLPEGFEVIDIFATNDRPWHSGESVSLTVDPIYQQLADRISAKNALLPSYRENLPDAPILLVIYSCIEVSRGVPIPHGTEEWTFPSNFDRILFFSALDNAAVEIRKVKLTLPGL
jgi:hypothetical protein